MKSIVQAVEITASRPSLSDNTADLDRLKRSVRQATGHALATCPLPDMAGIAGSFRSAGFQGAAVVRETGRGMEIIRFFPRMPQQLPGMALDLGTTHLEACLVDLWSGQEIARVSREHSQGESGADILTRIHYAERNAGLVQLQRATVSDINAMAADLAGRAGMDPGNIMALGVAGNTAMTHFLLGLSPYHMCREPYIPVANTIDIFPARDLGLKISPGAPIWVAPNVGSYFGGDLLAGIVACDLDLEDQPCMLVDVGTNAEVVLGGRDWLLACAGAAGPALEGGVARMGMRAGPGAIDKLTIDPDSKSLDYSTIGGEPALGICGAGLIDLAAQMYLAGMLDTRGRFRPESMQDRFVADEHNPSFVVVQSEQGGHGQPVMVRQSDINALIRSKAAMYAVLSTLVQQVGLSFKDLGRINVAGAFGRHINPQNAVVLGMLPDLSLDVYRPVSNTSLKGAVLAITDSGCRQRIVDTARRITYMEMNVNQEFMHRFSGARFIPHTDGSLFPSVSRL
ncbi:ASKHA domain-containing protein [Desulfonatronospira sp.]|uniref:ASKHA domain-containing protein n=1 Tax=Desulfonatronospira sp. TaxID=1962951 RepID=UPI0025BE5DFA|nr:ASKHA domain-containing protein [Desulfonatronospira sp.]